MLGFRLHTTLLAVVLPFTIQSLLTNPARADDALDGSSPRADVGRATPATKASKDSTSVTHHTITIEGKSVEYNAKAAVVTLRDDEGSERGRMFYVAYERGAAGDEMGDATTEPSATRRSSINAANDGRTNRPITFIFNGGPGAAAIWLHMGVGGPKRVVVPEDGAPPAPPYALSNNPFSWLDMTDLVFIDPIGTGYSRPAKGHERDFYGVRGDIDSVSDFIRIYLTEHQRWMSPKFLIGESYGTTRAAGISEFLHDRYGIDLCGITLISTVLNFQTLDPSAGNDTPFPLFLPSYSAIAHYHKRLPADLQALPLRDVVEQAKQFALGDYTTALVKGSSISDGDRDKIASQMSRYTGLPIEYVKRAKLRVDPSRFEKQLLDDQQRFIGRMDGRFTGQNADPLTDTPEFDPTLTGYVGVFSNGFNDYVRRELNYKDDAVYEFLSPRVGRWDFGPAGEGFYNVSTTLRQAMSKLPKLKLFVASGYYDLATPFTAADFTINQMPLSKELRANVTQKYYEGGHMLYLHHSALVALKGDLRVFYRGAVENGQAATRPSEER